VLDQLEPLLLETAGGAAEFIPAPDETKRLIRTYYAVKRNLLVRYGLTDIGSERQCHAIQRALNPRFVN